MSVDYDEDDCEEDTEIPEKEKKPSWKRKSGNRGGKDEVNLPEKKKAKIGVTKAAPTVEEITRLRETENLFHSNLFRMQIEEVLAEVKPKKSDVKAVKAWLDKFLKYLAEIDFDSKINSKNFKVKYPLANLPDDPKEGKFQFMKPSDVKVVGSFSTFHCLGPEFTVDIGIFMPKNLFLKEDYLNARYHKKRARYLCYIANHLLTSTALDSESPPEFCVRTGNPFKPVLRVTPSALWSSRIRVYIHAFPESDTFKLSRFSPEKNNLKKSWWASEDDAENTPTPYYNNSIAEDLAVEANESLRATVLEENPNLKDALMLLRVWLRQRGLDKGPGSFNGFILSMWVIHLMRCRKLNPLMSSYQVMRNVWLSFGWTDWLVSGPSLFNSQNNDGPSIDDYHSHFDVVFTDATGFVNIASEISNLTYLRVKEEAVLAMKYLDNPSLNSFQVLFMVPMPFLHQFDHIICIDGKKVGGANWNVDGTTDGQKRMDYLEDGRKLFLMSVVDHLQRGLGKRVSQIAVDLGSPTSSWSVLKKRPLKAKDTIYIGLKLNPQFALTVIEKGPEANLPEALEFRSFWGSKSELRRFKDGTVCETVTWDSPESPLSKRRLITREIVRHIFLNKLHIPEDTFTYLADQLDSVLVDGSSSKATSSTENSSLAVVKTLDELIKQVRDIETLPLPISSVLGASPSVRFSDVFPPIPYQGYSNNVGDKGQIVINEKLKKTLASSVEPIEGVVQLGLSRKWPEEIEAIKRIRAAFNIEIAKELAKRYQLLARPHPEFFEVMKDGYAFRLRVVYPREIALMKETVSPEGITAYRDTYESLIMERNLIHLPVITGALHGLGEQFPGYGPAVCLTKRWLRAQMIDGVLFPDVALELLVAKLFISPEPYRVVMQPQTAFLRMLRLFANTNWILEPVIINFNGELTRNNVTDIDEVFRLGREIKSLPPLFIATTYDRTGTVWTKNAPTLPVLYHLSKLAKETLSILETEFIQNLGSADFKKVFRPPLDFYDCVIHLNGSMNTRRTQGVDWEGSAKPKKSPPPPKNLNKFPLIGFNPVQCYLDELREHYDEYALFFHDTYGGNAIGVLFKPAALQGLEFKAANFSARKPTDDDDDPKLVLNRDAILADFYALGSGVVENINVNNK